MENSIFIREWVISEPTLTVLLLEWQPKYLNIIGITVSSNAEIAVDTSLGILGNLVQIPPSR